MSSNTDGKAFLCLQRVKLQVWPSQGAPNRHTFLSSVFYQGHLNYLNPLIKAYKFKLKGKPEIIKEVKKKICATIFIIFKENEMKRKIKLQNKLYIKQ